MVTPAVAGGSDYILLKSREKIDDCYSNPGEVWDPTYFLVKYRVGLHSGERVDKRANRKKDPVDAHKTKRRGEAGGE